MPALRLLASASLMALATVAYGQEVPDPVAGPVPAAQGSQPAAAQEQAQAGSVAATLALEALQPTLDEDGQPLLGADGQPVMSFQPVAGGSELIPGDEFRYVVTLDNQGTDVEAMEVALDIPPAGRLLPDTVTASVGADFGVGSTGTPELHEPLFVEVDGASVLNPSWAEAPERFDQLLATIERIESGETATVTYHLVVR